MRVAFRVDASTSIGLGHLKRCLSLADALRDVGARSTFVTRALGIDTNTDVSRLGFPQVLLRHPTSEDVVQPSSFPGHASWAGLSWQTDAIETVQALKAQAIDWLVVDHYAFDSKWHDVVGNAIGARIAVIDDLGDRNLSAALLIDHNHAIDHGAKYRGHIPSTATILGGPQYALLARPYWVARHCALRETVSSIGIFMGGADAGDLSSLALRACREELGFAGDIEIATTRSNPHLAELQALASRWRSTKVQVDLPDLATFFAAHDLQIGAGGGATWERCRIGAPMLTLIAAQNQRLVVEPLASMGVMHVVRGESPAASAIGHEVQRLIDNPGLRHSLARRARLLVDGLGTQRVAAYMKEQCN